MREGILETNIGKVYSLDQVKEAVRHAEMAAKEGKVLLKIA